MQLYFCDIRIFLNPTIVDISVSLVSEIAQLSTHPPSIRHPLLQEVMESFQSCYTNGTQPGTKNNRWFSAVSFIGHNLVLLTYTFTLESTFLPIATTIIIFIMMTTILVLPYKKQHATHIKMNIAFGEFSLFFSVLTKAQCLIPKTTKFTPI